MGHARWQDDDRLVADSGHALGWGVIGGVSGAAMAWKGWTDASGITSLAMVALGLVGASMFIAYAAHRQHLEVERESLRYSSSWGPFGKRVAVADRRALNTVWLHEAKGPTGRVNWQIEIVVTAASFPPFFAVDQYAGEGKAREAARVLASRLGVPLDTSPVYDPSVLLNRSSSFVGDAAQQGDEADKR